MDVKSDKTAAKSQSDGERTDDRSDRVDQKNQLIRARLIVLSLRLAIHHLGLHLHHRLLHHNHTGLLNKQENHTKTWIRDRAGLMTIQYCRETMKTVETDMGMGMQLPEPSLAADTWAASWAGAERSKRGQEPGGRKQPKQMIQG